jgi:hypothetical protein
MDPMKSVTYAGLEFFHEKDNKPHPKIHMKKAMLLSHRMIPTMLGFVG